jgi:hypothetical protein
MFFILGTPSLIAYIAIGILTPCFIALWKPHRSLLDVAFASAVLAALLYILVAGAIHGAGSLMIIGASGAFIIYLPSVFLVALLCRLLFRRKPYVFRGAPGTE